MIIKQFRNSNTVKSNSFVKCIILIYKMNNTINKFLLAGDKFMPEMHLRQPGFTYSACVPFTKHKERNKKFEQTGDTQYIYRNELDKACFQHDAAYADNKDLLNRTQADKILRYKAYGIANNPQFDGYQRGLAGIVWFINFLTQKHLRLIERPLEVALIKI